MFDKGKSDVQPSWSRSPIDIRFLSTTISVSKLDTSVGLRSIEGDTPRRKLVEAAEKRRKYYWTNFSTNGLAELSHQSNCWAFLCIILSALNTNLVKIYLNINQSDLRLSTNWTKFVSKWDVLGWGIFWFYDLKKVPI